MGTYCSSAGVVVRDANGPENRGKFRTVLFLSIHVFLLLLSLPLPSPLFAAFFASREKLFSSFSNSRSLSSFDEAYFLVRKLNAHTNLLVLKYYVVDYRLLFFFLFSPFFLFFFYKEQMTRQHKYTVYIPHCRKPPKL